MVAIVCSISGSKLAVAASSVPALAIATSRAMVSGMRAGRRNALIRHSSTPQMATWTTATSPTPMILPSMSCMGLTEETTSSSTRLFFSSIMEVMTIWPYMSRNM